MTTPADTLAHLRAQSFSVRRDGKRLLIQPISKLEGKLREAVITHRAALLDLLAEEEDIDARLRAIDAVRPPDLDEDNPVILDTFTLVKVSDADEPPEYLAVHPEWLQGIKDFAALRKREKVEAEQRRKEREQAKVKRDAKQEKETQHSEGY